mgnify:CR=1 FL=1
MATFIDEVEDEGLADSLDDMDKVEDTEEEPEIEAVELPEKYRNKTVAEVISMHQEAEKLIGKQGGEVGDLRKVVDDFIKTQSSKDVKAVETVEEDDDNFFTDPKNTVNKAIDSHPAIQEAKQNALQNKREQVVQKLKTEFPNYVETAQSEAFTKWVSSSKIRTELATRAEVNFDYDSAKELLSGWNERQEVVKTVSDTSKLDRDLQLKAANVGNTGTQESVSKKKYRRSDIIKLMQTDPDRYESLQDEIMLAYQEGRVK